MENDLKFAGQNPVMINYNGDTSDIYAPVSTSYADITLVSDHLMDDLYSANLDEICVRIEKRENDGSEEAEYETIWEGYKMPNTYSQDVTLNLDEIMITAIDPVSIMKYLKVDRIVTKPGVMTYAEFFGKAISYVMLTSSDVMVENTVSYGGDYDYTNGILDLKFQVSNFWDEMGEPASVYEVIEELLRPFCMTFCFDDNTFQIYDRNKTEGVRTFQLFKCIPEGLLMPVGRSGEATVVDDTWKDNNIQNPVIEIGTTYSKVTGVASTQVPEYSTMAIDKISYMDKELYDYNGFNVQRNKSKGYELSSPTATQAQLNTRDYWYYIWNGVYTNHDYELESMGEFVNWYLNINAGYKYLTGETGNPNDWGSILNFYGGANNPTATGKVEANEKPVEVKQRITAYAPDNGVPPEFLEDTDINWKFDNRDFEHQNPRLLKDATDRADAKWGSPSSSGQSRVVYHQEYGGVVLKDTASQTINIDLTQAYSRTGINTPINVLNNNTATNKMFYLHIQDEWTYYQPTIETADTCFFPYLWNVDNVKFNYIYFSRYATGHNFGCSEIWDRRKIYLYVETSSNTVLQFNGKDWVEGSSVSDTNCFYLLKLMNGENVFHTDFRYNVIETSDGEHYSLTGDTFTYYTDRYGNVVSAHVSSGTDHYCPRYDSEEYDWYRYVDKVSEGSLSINLPFINEYSATVVVDVFNSNLLGTTGMSEHMSYELTRYPVTFYYEVSGQGYYTYDEETRYVTLSADNVGDMYGKVMYVLPWINFIPVNASYIKGEHLDLNISMSVPESNLGQMFSQSDIKYICENRKNYMEEFETAPFRVNTFNTLVLSSFSYLMYGNDVADPDEFIIKGISGRPESYVIQAYMNWLGRIRKIYTKTIVPGIPKMSNTRRFILSSEVGENKMMVISDNWDVKTNRHSVTAIECQNLDVTNVGTSDAVEIPRRARNDLFNLPTSVKKK